MAKLKYVYDLPLRKSLPTPRLKQEVLHPLIDLYSYVIPQRV